MIVFQTMDSGEVRFERMRPEALTGMALRCKNAYYEVVTPESILESCCDMLEEVNDIILRMVQVHGAVVEYGLPGQGALYFPPGEAPSRETWVREVLARTHPGWRIFDTPVAAEVFVRERNDPAVQAAWNAFASD